MATIEHSTILAAPPGRVFALLERVEDFADYSDLIHSIEALGDDRYRWHVHAVGPRLALRCGDYRAPCSGGAGLGIAGRGGEPGALPACARWRAAPRSTLTLTYKLGNKLLEKAVNKAATPLVGRVSRQILERVAERL